MEAQTWMEEHFDSFKELMGFQCAANFIRRQQATIVKALKPSEELVRDLLEADFLLAADVEASHEVTFSKSRMHFLLRRVMMRVEEDNIARFVDITEKQNRELATILKARLTRLRACRRTELWSWHELDVDLWLLDHLKFFQGCNDDEMALNFFELHLSMITNALIPTDELVFDLMEEGVILNHDIEDARVSPHKRSQMHSLLESTMKRSGWSDLSRLSRMINIFATYNPGLGKILKERYEVTMKSRPTTALGQS